MTYRLTDYVSEIQWFTMIFFFQNYCFDILSLIWRKKMKRFRMYRGSMVVSGYGSGFHGKEMKPTAHIFKGRTFNEAQKKMDKLPHYTAILEGKQKSKYLTCKTIPVAFKTDNDLETLWHIHDSHHDSCHKKMKTSLLDLKTFIAEKIIYECHLCERRCKSNRTKQAGICGVSQSQIASEFLHYGEEHILVPSYTIFFSRMHL